MKVEIEQIQGKAGWEVRLGTCAVSFRSQEEAVAFVERLQARLDAPHYLPVSCDELLAELSLPVSTT
jgi:hypothetical protein